MHNISVKTYIILRQWEKCYKNLIIFPLQQLKFKTLADIYEENI